MNVAIQLKEAVTIVCQLSDVDGALDWCKRQNFTVVSEDRTRRGPSSRTHMGMVRVTIVAERFVGSPQKHGFLPADVSGLLAA